jgi:hypothetical protein
MVGRILFRDAIVLLLFILFLCIAFSGIIGKKTIANETIMLSPGGQKTYDLPPGYVIENITTIGTPVDITYSGIGTKGYSHQATSGYGGIGTPFGVKYTVTNPGDADTNVSLLISTGILNPFGYIWI